MAPENGAPRKSVEQGIANRKIQEILPAISREKGLFQGEKKAIFSIFFQVKKNPQTKPTNSTIINLHFFSKYGLS